MTIMKRAITETELMGFVFVRLGKTLIFNLRGDVEGRPRVRVEEGVASPRDLLLVIHRCWPGDMPDRFNYAPWRDSTYQFVAEGMRDAIAARCTERGLDGEVAAIDRAIEALRRDETGEAGR